MVTASIAMATVNIVHLSDIILSGVAGDISLCRLLFWCPRDDLAGFIEFYSISSLFLWNFLQFFHFSTEDCTSPKRKRLINAIRWLHTRKTDRKTVRHWIWSVPDACPPHRYQLYTKWCKCGTVCGRILSLPIDRKYVDQRRASNIWAPANFRWYSNEQLTRFSYSFENQHQQNYIASTINN